MALAAPWFINSPPPSPSSSTPPATSRGSNPRLQDELKLRYSRLDGCRRRRRGPVYLAMYHAGEGVPSILPCIHVPRGKIPSTNCITRLLLPTGMAPTSVYLRAASVEPLSQACLILRQDVILELLVVVRADELLLKHLFRLLQLLPQPLLPRLTIL